ncbi:FprA family A-type flavoprotein [Anaerosporobacter sp.]|uniref:FprA family A-type flavoprotein n=1 Tax=Anaerosporobacter sp. TaxID=1872529 RepID=UPI00286F23CA|nr:FprA family A-type flavoprotein [Anaerosporobacter sp.]
MEIVKLRDDIYYVGAVDWNVRSFHGYTTNRGATYNAYLIIDEKITLIDTVKEPFAEELLERISEIIDPSKIDYIVSNHVEMDHSGAIPAVMEVAKNATIVTSAPSGLKGLQAHYGDKYNYQTVKAGDTLSLGKRSLTFVATPMLHWPDNMVTYCSEEKILFSNDAFGQHYASSKHFDDEVDMAVVMQEAEKYYANILMPYGKQANQAIDIVQSLPLEMIAPSHGVILRTHITEMLDKYRYFCSEENEKRALVVYDSMWHSTEKMAQAILEGFKKAGVECILYDLKENHISDIATQVLKAEYLVVGSPTLNTNILPTVGAFLTYMKGLSPKGKKGFAFGSYGWAAQNVAIIQKELEAMKVEIIKEPIKMNYVPTKEQLREIEEEVAELIVG